jgi:tetratricopeptide (TPR) repeat protein
VRRIVDLSKERQVIVFTHNIWFTTELLAHYEKNPNDCAYYDLTRNDQELGIITKGTHPRADTYNSLKARLNTNIQAAQQLTGEPQAALVEKGYEYLRSICEVIVETELLQGVTQRYQPNVMMTRLANIKADRLQPAITAIMPIFEDCCRYMSGQPPALTTLWTYTLIQLQDRRHAEREFRQAMDAADHKDYIKAIDRVKNAAKADANNAYYDIVMGVLGERALDAHVDFVSVTDRDYGLGLTVDKALSVSSRSFERALTLNPRDACALHNLGWIHMLCGRWEIAGRYLKEAVAKDKADPISRISLGLLCEREGNCERAGVEYTAAMLLDPGVAESAFFRALTQRRPSLAAQVIGGCRVRLQVEADSGDTIASAKLGKLYLIQRRLAEARAWLQRAGAQLPNLASPGALSRPFPSRA